MKGEGDQEGGEMEKAAKGWDEGENFLEEVYKTWPPNKSPRKEELSKVNCELYCLGIE